MIKIFEFENHCYPIEVFFAQDVEAWNHFVRKHTDAGEDAEPEPYPTHAAAVTLLRCKGKLNAAVITFSPEADRRSSTEVIGLMAHECVHVLQHMEDAANIERFDNETQAYMVHKLLMWLMTTYTEVGRKFCND